MPKYSKDYKEMLLDQLADPEIAAGYLNEHASYSGSKRKELLLQAFRNVLEAQGFAKLAKKSGMSKRTLYHAFSERGNPTWETLDTLLSAIGIHINFSTTPTKPKPKRAA